MRSARLLTSLIVLLAAPAIAIASVSMESMTLAFQEKRYETARRIGLSLLMHKANSPDIVFLLHKVYRAQGDFDAGRELLESLNSQESGIRFEKAILLAQDYQKLSGEDHYRVSDEISRGLSLDEYVTQCRSLSAKYAAQAAALAKSPDQLQRAERLTSQNRPSAPASELPPAASISVGRLRGKILLPDGTPARNSTVTLGMAAKSSVIDPSNYWSTEMHFDPKVPEVQTISTMTEADGVFVMPRVPEGMHAFLAVTLDPARFEIATRFVAREVEVKAGEETYLGALSAGEWRSAPPLAAADVHPAFLQYGEAQGTKLSEKIIRNPFHYDFPRQLLLLDLPADADPSRLLVTKKLGVPIPFQVVDQKIAIFCELLQRREVSIAIYQLSVPVARVADPPVRLNRESEKEWQIDTGVARFKVAGPAAAPGASPILAVRGPDEVWRGKGRMNLPEGGRVLVRSLRVVHEGELMLTLEATYQLANNQTWSVTMTALAGEPALLVHEKGPALENAAFEFSLREFSGGRGFLHWSPENGSRHWSNLAKVDRELARLPETVPWWIPPQGFGYAMTADGLESRDYIGVVTLRRGEWIDRDFEKLTHGPVGESGRPNWELDWPYPEMVGSTLSMITARTTADGDAYFRFKFFDGERKWALLVSALDRNDGLHKEIASFQHRNSSPRLQEFQNWRFDVQDVYPRPMIVAARERLIELRKRKEEVPFSGLWRKIRDSKVPGPAQGLIFAVEGNPALAWRKRSELLAQARIRSRMTLLGRDWGDMYSPVGARPITAWAEEYDLIAASGVFNADEEREVRAFFILMGHMFMERDFMNWSFGARNANFEADRVDVVGTIGLVFKGHPDAKKFVDHAVDRTREALISYCTPGGGKWYENPACYYLQALKCRANLVYHLSRHAGLELATVPRLREFLRWGINLLTPPMPLSYTELRDGDTEIYETSAKARRVPPIGDHGHIGRWLPEYYAVMGQAFMKADAGFGSELLAAYFTANGDGADMLSGLSSAIDPRERQFSNLPLLFASLDRENIPESPSLQLKSRRLEGFGAVLRQGVGGGKEDYLLVKQGPGGYRYHRTEGSFIWFVDGKPIVYEGGEGGETWRHSTLSFYDVHTPLAAGRVEMFMEDPAIQWVRGMHPQVVKPGEPIFLSDRSGHELVTEAWRRFEQKPAVSRSFVRVGREYLVIHDEMDLAKTVPVHWHLQVVANGCSATKNSHVFQGRFDIDLEVLFPGQTFDKVKTGRLAVQEHWMKDSEQFAQQHLQMSAVGRDMILAVLRPLRGELKGESLTATYDKVGGTKVEGNGISDRLWTGSSVVEWQSGETEFFSGCRGAILVRPHLTGLVLSGPGKVGTGGCTLESDGPAAVLAIGADSAELRTHGPGGVTVKKGAQVFRYAPTGPAAWKLTF